MRKRREKVSVKAAAIILGAALFDSRLFRVSVQRRN